MRVLDNVIALRIIYLLVTPIQDTDAYKLGLIDSSGKTIKKAKTPEEQNATSMLHRLVWNLKRMISLVPGGSTKIGSLAAAYLLVKEGLDNNWSEYRIVNEYLDRKESLDNTRYIQEESLVISCLEKIKSLEEDTPTNSSGTAVSTDIPTIKKKILSSRQPKAERNIVDILP